LTESREAPPPQNGYDLGNPAAFRQGTTHRRCAGL